MADVELPGHVATRRRDGRRTVLLHRSLAVIGSEVVEVRSARSAAWLPLAGLLLVVAAGTWIAVTRGTLPFWLMVLLLLFCLLAAPVAVMGLVSAFLGADVVADRRKGSVTFQQGFLGMGVGTRELVPFGRIARFEVTVEGDQPDRWRNEADTLRQFALFLEKDNGKRLLVARVPVPASRQEDGMDRILATGQAFAAVTDSRVDIPAGWELIEVDAKTLERAPGPKPRRRKKRG